MSLLCFDFFGRNLGRVDVSGDLPLVFWQLEICWTLLLYRVGHEVLNLCKAAGAKIADIERGFGVKPFFFLGILQTFSDSISHEFFQSYGVFAEHGESTFRVSNMVNC